MARSNKLYNNLAIIALISTTVLWGTTFIITKTLTQDIPIFFYLGMRYLIAIIGFLPFLYRIKKINIKLVIAGVFTGVIYFLAMHFQTYGLQTTTAGKAGFITGLSTIMVPLISWLFYKKKINLRIWIGVILASMGMGFLLLESEFNLNIGDLLVLVCAVFCALYIIFNDVYVKVHDIYLYTIVQLLVLIITCFSSSIILKEPANTPNFSISLWIIMLYMGFGATTLTFLFQNWGQKYQDPSIAAIIFALEPVFAALFGFLLGNEILTIPNMLGMGLIFIAIILAVWNNERK